LSRNYSSFSAAAKSRFLPVARALGYKQESATVYAKARNGWHESFNLQASNGTDFFYVNYGITIQKLCPVGEDRSIHTCGHLLGARLCDADGTSGFPRGSLEEIEASATRIVDLYRKQAFPWFNSLDSWAAIAAEYLRVNPISEAEIGSHSSRFGQGPRCATYGFLLLKSGQRADAIRWLSEAERILSLPEYFTRDGRLVHEREKFARLRKPDEGDLETLQNVRRTLDALSDA
jgi:hypothetical protein